jgi:hypothetical protein
MDFGEEFVALVGWYIDLIMPKAQERSVEDVPVVEYIASETIGDVLEKLLILHIRAWHLEDELVETDDEAEAGRLSKKIMHCVRTKRPRLVKALNTMMAEIARGNADLVADEDIKVYHG